MVTDFGQCPLTSLPFFTKGRGRREGQTDREREREYEWGWIHAKSHLVTKKRTPVHIQVVGQETLCSPKSGTGFVILSRAHHRVSKTDKITKNRKRLSVKMLKIIY